jgi:putative cell wall-binding protein
MSKRQSIGISIGDVTGKGREMLSKTIREVLDSGFKNHSSDVVLVKALDLIQNAFQVHGTTITGCVFGEQK